MQKIKKILRAVFEKNHDHPLNQLTNQQYQLELNWRWELTNYRSDSMGPAAVAGPKRKKVEKGK